jgi:NADPH2:quinone reductase
MKAILVEARGGPDVLQLREIPDPVPAKGEVTIKVSFAGVGLVDVLFRRGDVPFATPFTPGIEVSGWVHAVGEGVSGLVPGDPVAALLNDFSNMRGAGGYAELANARAALTVRLDDGADLADAASVIVNGATAWMAVSRIARVQPGEHVAVLGATGGLGGGLGQFARRAQAGRLIGVIGGAAKREAAARLGYTDILTSAELNEARLRGADHIDVVFDTVGGEARRIAFGALAPMGRMVILGNASGVDVDFSGDALWFGTKTVQGLNVGGITHLVPDRVAAAAREVLEWTAGNQIDSAPAVILPMAEAPNAHRLLEERKVIGKVVLRVDDADIP